MRDAGMKRIHAVLFWQDNIINCRNISGLMGFRGKDRRKWDFEFRMEAIICNSLMANACHNTFDKTIEIYST